MIVEFFDKLFDLFVQLPFSPIAFLKFLFPRMPRNVHGAVYTRAVVVGAKRDRMEVIDPPPKLMDMMHVRWTPNA